MDGRRFFCCGMGQDFHIFDIAEFLHTGGGEFEDAVGDAQGGRMDGREHLRPRDFETGTGMPRGKRVIFGLSEKTGRL